MSIRNRGEGKTKSWRRAEKVIQFFLLSKYLKSLTVYWILLFPVALSKLKKKNNLNYMESGHSTDDHN